MRHPPAERGNVLVNRSFYNWGMNDLKTAMEIPAVADANGMAESGSWDTSRPFEFRLDKQARMVRGQARGFWTVFDTESYLRGLEQHVSIARDRYGRARVLIDRREVAHQAPDVRDRLAAANGSLFREGDLIALVVATSIDKAGLRQRMPHDGTKAFISIEAAEKWLSAHVR